MLMINFNLQIFSHYYSKIYLKILKNFKKIKKTPYILKILIFWPTDSFEFGKFGKFEKNWELLRKFWQISQKLGKSAKMCSKPSKSDKNSMF